MIWDSTGVKTNPLASTVLADSGPLTPGWYECQIILSATVAGLAEIQHRDATDTTNLSTQLIATGPSSSTSVSVRIVIRVAGERVRLVLLDAILTGRVQGSIIRER